MKENTTGDKFMIISDFSDSVSVKSTTELLEVSRSGYYKWLIGPMISIMFYLSDYRTFNEAFDKLENFIESVYNEKRLHLKKGYLRQMNLRIR